MAPRSSSRGRWIVVPESRDHSSYSYLQRARQRRKRILEILLGAVAVSFLVALFAGGAAWTMNLALDASLALYVVLLIEAKRRRAEQGTKVRSLGRDSVERDEFDDDVEFHEPVKGEATY